MFFAYSQLMDIPELIVIVTAIGFAAWLIQEPFSGLTLLPS